MNLISMNLVLMNLVSRQAVFSHIMQPGRTWAKKLLLSMSIVFDYITSH